MALLILLVVLAAGCTQTGQVTKEPVKIGFMASLTGDAATLGQNARIAAEMAAKEINAEGGINGRPLEIIYEDSKCNAKDGAEAGNKLMNIDKVPVIVGSVCSSEILAIAPQAEKSETVVMGICTSAPSITNAGDFIFRDYPSDSFQGKYAAEYAYQKLNLRKFAVMYCMSDYCEGIKDKFSKRFKELGGQIVDTESFEQSSRDLRSQLTKIKAANPEGIYFASYTEGTIVGINQMKELGINSTIMGTDAFDDTKIWESVGAAGDRVRYTTVPDASDDFNRKFSEYSGKTATLCSPQAYDAVHIIADVMRKAGMNSEAIKNGLYNVKGYKGTSGTITFDQNGDLADANYIVKIVRNGKAEQETGN